MPAISLKKEIFSETICKYRERLAHISGTVGMSLSLGLLVVGHPWGDGCSQLLDPLDFFGFAALVVVDAGGLRGYGLPKV